MEMQWKKKKGKKNYNNPLLSSIIPHEDTSFYILS